MLRVVVITGAGLSVDSGIRPYRGPTGIYTEMMEKYGRAPETIVTPQCVHKEPELFWELWEQKMLSAASPCDAHKALVEIEQKTHFLEVTQNVDGLSRKAGIPDNYLIELHGTAQSYRCNRCGIAHQPHFREGMGVPRCYRCGDPDHAPIRPNVVLFGENIKSEHYKRACIAAKGADILICVGTSMQFGYLMDMVYAAMGNNAVVVNIDPQAVRNSYFDIALPLTASEGLAMVNASIEKEMNGREEFTTKLREKWLEYERNNIESSDTDVHSV